VKAKKLGIVRVRHPDAEDDEAGTHWTQLTPKQLADWRWEVALGAAEEGNLRELVRALLIVAAVPDWVRKALTQLFKDERPLSAAVRKIGRGVAAFRKAKAAQAGKRRQLSDQDLIKQAAAQTGATETQIYNVVVRHRGAAYDQLRRRPRPRE
jgi:hypothetical protein